MRQEVVEPWKPTFIFHTQSTDLRLEASQGITMAFKRKAESSAATVPQKKRTGMCVCNFAKPLAF